MGITVVGIGAADSATPFAPAFSGPVLLNDILLVAVEQISLTSPEASPTATGFAHVPGSPVGPDSIGTVLSVLYKRAVGGETSVTVSGPNNHAMTRAATVRGCKSTGFPWPTNPTVAIAAAGSTTATWPDLTIPAGADNSLICLFIATGRDANSTTNLGALTNGNLTSITERMDNWTATGGGGGIGLVTGFKAAPGAIGASTATMGTTDGQAMLVLALQEEPADPFTIRLPRRGPSYRR